MNFENLNGVWKLKRLYITCIELIFKFFMLMSSVFSLDISSQMHKTHLESFD